jgi:hypothetical protein
MSILGGLGFFVGQLAGDREHGAIIRNVAPTHHTQSAAFREPCLDSIPAPLESCLRAE